MLGGEVFISDLPAKILAYPNPIVKVYIQSPFPDMQGDIHLKDPEGIPDVLPGLCFLSTRIRTNCKPYQVTAGATKNAKGQIRQMLLTGVYRYPYHAQNLARLSTRDSRDESLPLGVATCVATSSSSNRSECIQRSPYRDYVSSLPHWQATEATEAESIAKR
jgi:hypothetical protein